MNHYERKQKLKKQLERIYDWLYEETDKILKQHKPCKFNNKCGKCTCIGTYRDDPGLCCKGCQHLSDKGCTVKSLSCKLWLCGTLSNNSNFPWKRWDWLYKWFSVFGFYHFRGTKEEHIKEALKVWDRKDALKIVRPVWRRYA